MKPHATAISKGEKMEKSETQKKTSQAANAIVQAIKPLLIDAGFVKKGMVFNRKTADGLTQIVEFRRYKKYWCEPTMFIVDLAIRVPEAERRNFDISENETEFFKGNHCSSSLRLENDTKKLFGYDLMFCLDIGDVKDPFYWFPHAKQYRQELTAEEIISRIIHVFNNGAMKFFDDFSSRDKVLENWERYRKFLMMGGDLWQLEASFIYGAKGEMDKAKKMFWDYYKKNKSNKGHRELLDGYAKECGF